jgi:hypothetical protein
LLHFYRVFSFHDEPSQEEKQKRISGFFLSFLLWAKRSWKIQTKNVSHVTSRPFHYTPSAYFGRHGYAYYMRSTLCIKLCITFSLSICSII